MTKRDDMPATCQGTNCGKARDDQAHSIECIAETAASQGWMPPLPVGEVREIEPGRFVKQPVSDAQYYSYALQYAEQRVRAALQSAYDALFSVEGDKAPLFDAQTAIRKLMEGGNE